MSRHEQVDPGCMVVMALIAVIVVIVLVVQGVKCEQRGGVYVVTQFSAACVAAGPK